MSNDLISRSALLGLFEGLRDMQANNNARAALELAVRIIDKALSIDAAPKWISAEDRLPEKREWVIVVGEFVPEGGWFAPLIAEFFHDSWRIKDDAYSYPEDLHIKVTHWMPLPEPPEVLRNE